MRLNGVEREYLQRRFTSVTSRELEVLFAICEGGTNDQVAQRLFIALPTLRTHVMRLNRKLSALSKTDALRIVTQSLLDGYRNGVLQATSCSDDSAASEVVAVGPGTSVGEPFAVAGPSLMVASGASCS